MERQPFSALKNMSGAVCVGGDGLGVEQRLKHLDLFRRYIHIFHLIHLVHHIGTVRVFCKLTVLIVKPHGV